MKRLVRQQRESERFLRFFRNAELRRSLNLDSRQSCRKLTENQRIARAPA